MYVYLFYPCNQILMRRKDLFYHPVLAGVHPGSESMMDWRPWGSLPINGSEAEICGMEKDRIYSHSFGHKSTKKMACAKIHASQISDNSMEPRIQACGPRETFHIHAGVSHCQRKNIKQLYINPVGIF